MLTMIEENILTCIVRVKVFRNQFEVRASIPFFLCEAEWCDLVGGLEGSGRNE